MEPTRDFKKKKKDEKKEKDEEKRVLKNPESHVLNRDP